MDRFEQDLQQCLAALHAGGLILYAADHGWCIGCDATHEAAVAGMRRLLNGITERSLPVLLTEEREVLQWVAAADLSVFEYALEQAEPTAISFDLGLGFADSLLAPDGSVLVLLTQQPFCRHLVKRFRKPIVALPVSICQELHSTPALVFNSIEDYIVYKSGQTNVQGNIPSRLHVLYWNKGKPLVSTYC